MSYVHLEICGVAQDVVYNCKGAWLLRGSHTSALILLAGHQEGYPACKNFT